jgi:hypothetical protein
MLQRRKVLNWPILIALLALTAHGANLAGKWSGTIEIDDSGGKIQTPVELYLEQKGGALSGKIGRSKDPESVEIRNAKVEGDKVTFEASSTEASAAMKFSLTVRGEQMLGEMKGAAQGNDIVAKVTFSRVK